MGLGRSSVAGSCEEEQGRFPWELPVPLGAMPRRRWAIY